MSDWIENEKTMDEWLRKIDTLQRKLDVAMSGINKIIDENLPFYVTDIAKKTKAEIDKLGADK